MEEIVPCNLDFPMQKAGKQSFGNRRLKYGVGINDAPYKTEVWLQDKRFVCAYYTKWADMLSRAYSKTYHIQRPNYINCTVCPEWRSFMRFREWMEQQTWQGMHLDKDVLLPGNKIYSPTTCIFISPQLNALLGNNKNQRGKYPQGVYKDTSCNSYTARIKYKGKGKHLGNFPTIIKAKVAYDLARKEKITKIANNQTNVKLRDALLIHANLIT